MRSLFSYYKIQNWISKLIRNKRIFIQQSSNEYLNIGCGSKVIINFVNLDYHWVPGLNVCWDLEREALPYAEQSFRGIYTEHCLEHINYKSIPGILKELRRILKPGGVLRIIVPDGELYLRGYFQILSGQNIKLPYQESYRSPLERINGLFRNHGHQFIFDFETFKLLLTEAGFSNIIKQEYRSGSDPNLLQDSEERKIESLYIEALK